MLRFRICEAELEELRGLPHEARTLYVEGLRPYMDFDGSRIVGLNRKISYQQCYELLEVRPEAGSKRGGFYQPSRSQVRALFKLLERSGLIVRIPQPRFSGLVFRLVLADTGLIRPNEERPQQRPQQRHHSNTVDKSVSVGSNRVSGAMHGARDGKEQHEQQPEEQHTPGNTNNNHNYITYSGANVVKIEDANPQGVFKTLIGDWFPDAEVVRNLVRVFSIDPLFVESERIEFVVYWQATGKPAVSWDAKFMQHIQIRWARKRDTWRPPELMPGSDLYTAVSALLRCEYEEYFMGGYD